VRVACLLGKKKCTQIFDCKASLEDLLFVLLAQFLYKLNKFILFSLYNMFQPFSPSSGKSFYINTLLFLPLFPYVGQCLQILQFSGRRSCVIYSINASCNTYESLKY
jgi:hypothetical protein